MSIRVWILIILLSFSFLVVVPLNVFEKGVIIKNVEKNSTALEYGLKQGMLIKAVDSQKVNSLSDYNSIISAKFENIKEPIKLTLTTDSGDIILLTKTAPEITIGGIPRTRIKTGLDLSGGARALIKAANFSISESEINDLIAITSERLNVYGISDINLRSVKDLEGNNYLLIEVAGASSSELEELISKQGKFEGKIGNQTVFEGGKDISHVERSGQYAGIESCYDNQQSETICKFTFPVSLTEEAAERHAEITSKLQISSENPDYLSEKLDLYIDGVLVDSLFISKDLKGQATTQISIQGSGVGSTKQEARTDAEANMNKLQTILITGSLPYKLEIVKLDTISPVLGKTFTNNILLLGTIVFAIVSVILFVRYRKIKITLAIILTMFSEAFITLAIAALIKWNLDAPSIAGIIAGIGTGVNDQIIIVDESVSNTNLGIKERIKRALFIIFSAFFTIVAAMLPLFKAGAGMLRGFALTTIIGVSVGILITRPAFADILKKIQE